MRRHWTTIVVFLALLHSTAAIAQTPGNMVYNPSFEDYSRCPQKIDALGIMTEVDAWWQPTKGSSDYFNACAKRDCSVPRNKMGVQEPHDGLAYCGIYCSQENYREYIQTQLKQPLQKGQRYRVSFWVSLADKSPHAVASLGALFTEEMIADTASWEILTDRETIDINDAQQQTIATWLQPQVSNSKDSVLADSKGWHEICGEFVAQGGERYLTIGNFAPFNHSAVTSTDHVNAVLQGAYYYIDDVCVTAAVPSTQVIAEQDLPMPKAGEVKTLNDIFFATGKSDILPQSYNALQQLLELLRQHPGIRIELRGHTDNQGTADFNMKLSLARAEAVANYLIARGIDARRLSTQGFGKTMPIADNDTPEGRSKNRRVEYQVIAY